MVIEVVAYETRFGSLHLNEGDALEIEHKEALESLNVYLTNMVGCVYPKLLLPDNKEAKECMKYVILIITMHPNELVSKLKQLGFLDGV